VSADFLSTRPPLPPPTGEMKEKQGPEAAAMLGAARSAARQGKLQDALGRFEEYIRRFPNDLAVRKEYAGLLSQADDPLRAAEEYLQILALRRADVDLRLLLGDAYVQARQYRHAMVQYQQALELAQARLEAAVRLARAATFVFDYCRALQVYDRYLAALRPGDPKVPADLPALFLDFGKAPEALAFALPLRTRYPDDLELLAVLVRIHARLGDRPRAAQLAEELASRGPRANAIRLSLAEGLFASGEFELAQAVYQNILQADPANQRAQIGAARTALNLFQPEQARAILCAITPTPALDRNYRMARAEYHQTVGEYTDSLSIYRDLLCRNEEDHGVRLARGLLYQLMHEYEKAKADFARIPPAAPEWREARLGIASTLADQRRFPEAVEAYHKFLADNPSDGPAVAQLVRTLGRADQPDRAVAVATGFLKANGRVDAAVIPVQFALAKVFLDAHHYAEAAGVYGCLAARPDTQVPAAFYGLGRAHDKMGDTHKAAEDLGTVATLPGGFARNRILLADLFSGDYDDPHAIEMLQSVLRGDPHNLAALIRLADVQTRHARFTANVEEAVATAKTILTPSPANVRGLLALARAQATVKDYHSSVATYDRLIVLDPTFRVPQREKARVLYAANAFGASAAAYQQIQNPPAEALLADELASYAGHDPHAQPLLDPYLHGSMPGHMLPADIGKLAATCADPTAGSALRGILADYEARSAEQNGAQLESEAKSYKGWVNFRAIPLYQQLIAAEPDNTEALFDLGQTYGNLQLTRNALSTFGQILQVDPVHRDSLVALDRGSLEMAPQLTPDLLLFSQRGRNGLASIDRFYYGGRVAIPYADENQFWGLAIHGALYHPVDGTPNLNGSILTAFGQAKTANAHLLLSGLANAELYPDRIRSRVTYDFGATYLFSDAFRVRATTFLNNVIENGGSMTQDIFRYGYTLGADGRPTRFWDVGTNYRFAYYSDKNFLNELYLYNNYRFTLPPKQLQVVLTALYLSYQHGTIFAIPNDPEGAIHPYFAPSSFLLYDASLQWTHWLSRDWFAYSNQCWYMLQEGLAFDNRGHLYDSVRAGLHADLKSWLTVSVEGQGLFSTVYNYGQVYAYMTIRWGGGH
jgi:tetratricopeptide (TPR) repeat protein